VRTLIGSRGTQQEHIAPRPIVTSPFAITVSDLESVLPSTHLRDLSEILDEYHRCNRTTGGGVALGRLAYADIPPEGCIRLARQARIRRRPLGSGTGSPNSLAVSIHR
jgi:hypothetical protein